MSDPDVEWFDQPIGEAIEIQSWSDEWPEIGRLWEKRLTEVLSPLPVRVDHVGSTAVPGLAAKPVIDIQVQVPDLSDESSYALALESVGTVLRARGAAFRFFRPPAGRVREVHIHVCEVNSAWARDHLAFRDALRGDSTLARDYERLKRHLAATVTERADYNAGKESFILAAVEKSTAARSASDRD